MSIRIVVLFGTRPECIKLAPVIESLKKIADFEIEVWVTGQHADMLTQAMDAFEIVPDQHLSLMTKNQSLEGFVTKAIIGIGELLDKKSVDAIIVQGDTSTVFAGALAAFYRKTPVFHVEAGLRTYDLYNPFPEEMNRQLVTRLSALHFSPTQLAAQNLRREGIEPDKIILTGNTSIDALYMVLQKLKEEKISIPFSFENTRPFVLLTIHRRENMGAYLLDILDAISELADEYTDIDFLFPVHKNPNVRNTVFEKLSGKNNIMLTEPMDYISFCKAMNDCLFIITDSGGVQEEAPALNKPVLVIRKETERPEGVKSGAAILVGNEKSNIIYYFKKLIEDQDLFNRMAQAENPYGEGKAAERISSCILNYFKK
ncbi:MAG: UDP-N-acetylglucosamine 2-epimerase (non-hydrolyzing) [Hydrotalea sp.]|nr:UDP-N-acetylglucosamine 2-epimerase (non-hydrolyzing) [Hydrotalea sp.]